MDNCEHVAAGAAEVVDRLLGATEGLKVLATGRERLVADGETVFAVAPLDTSSDRSAASELFFDRAVAVGATLTERDHPVVDELCRRLDGLPLALELAAGRLRSLTLREIRAGIDQSLSVLGGGRRAVARHRSLDAALDWSYQPLDPTDRETLAAAATFVAPFDAKDVAALIGLSDEVALDRLAGLVERSLTFRSGDQFRLFETVREFVLERTAPADRKRLLRRHAGHVADRLVEASRRLRVAEDDGPIALARRLVPDLRQAFGTAVGEGDATLAVDIVVAGRDLAFDAMLPELLTWGEQAAELGAAHDSPLAVDAFAIAAQGRWKMGDLDAMRRLLERADREAVRLGVPDRYEVLGTLGTEDIAHGRMADAIDRLRRSIASAEARDDLHRLAEGGATLAICRAYAHDDGAVADATWLISHVAPRSGVVPRSWCWYAAGECLLDDDPAMAAERLARAVELARRGGATFVEGVAGASLASLAVRGGRLGEAIAQYRWLVPLWLRAGVRAPFWTMMRSVVELLAAAGDDESAARLLGAVTTSGNDVVAADDARLRRVAARLRGRLGNEAYEQRLAVGRSLDAAAAAALTSTAFDHIA
jgi:predicted ATPase